MSEDPCTFLCSSSTNGTGCVPLRAHCSMLNPSNGVNHAAHLNSFLYDLAKKESSSNNKTLL